MRYLNHCFESFCSFSNLLQAWKKTRRGSGRSAAGAAFFVQLEPELIVLRESLLQQTWTPLPYRFFDIHDPKHRTIAVSDFRDRVVHHALVNILEPFYERRFIYHSFATRKGKGVHAAIAAAQGYLRKHKFYFKTDIEKFFDSVSHDILLRILAHKIHDERFMNVCEIIIRHGGKDGRGLPIGNRTSQFFANVYLDQLDHFLKEHLGLKAYVRYMDDFVIFSDDKSLLKEVRNKICVFLSDTLELQLNPGASYLNSWQHGLPFLGRRIFPAIIRLKRENLRRITRRIALREKELTADLISETTFLQSMNSYWAMLSFYSEHKGLRLSLLQC